MPPRSSSREKSKENTNVGGALRSSGDESSLIEKQQQYIELLENELKSLKQHFDRTMEKIFSNPLFGSGRMMTNGLSSLLSSSAATTTTQPVGTANEKKKRTREKSHEEESEESESESSEEEKQQQETSSRKSRLRHDKKSSLMDLESDEETIVDNVFQMVRKIDNNYFIIIIIYFEFWMDYKILEIILGFLESTSLSNC